MASIYLTLNAHHTLGTVESTLRAFSDLIITTLFIIPTYEEKTTDSY